MIDIKFLRENPEAVKQNIRNKFQDSKLELVDKVIELDAESRAVKAQADELRANRNKVSKQIGALMAQGKKEEGMALKEEVTRQAEQLADLEKKEEELSAKVTEIMTARIKKLSVSVSLLCLILKFLTTQILWKSSTALTLTQQERLQATAFTILWAILQDFTVQLSLMQEIL